MKKITVIIPCFNEEQHLEAALKTVKWADEIMVVDSFSSDNSLKIAKKHTDFVLQRKYENSANQKNWAIPQATHDWIFLLDADERVTPDLQHEIQAFLKTEDHTIDAYWIGRDNFFMGKPLRYALKGDKVIRLFKKECRYQDLNVHSEIITDGLKVDWLKGKLEHHTLKNIDHFLAKTNRYAGWSAKDYHTKTPRVTFFHLWIKPLYRFIKHYIINRGFLDGQVGFIVSSIMAWSVFLRYWKILEIRYFEKLK